MLACSEKQGPVGAPGGRDGIVLRYVTPRAQVVTSSSTHVVTLALSVSRTGDDGRTAPFAGALLEAALDEGRGVLRSRFATSDSRGVAVFQLEMPARGDRTRVIVTLERDARSFLPFEVVSTSVVAVEAGIGQIQEIRPPAEGVILRFPAAPGAEYVVIPYQTDLDRRTGYRLLYQVTGDVLTGSLELPPLPRGLGPALDGPGDVRRGDIEPAALTPSADVPLAVNIQSCGIKANRMAPLRYDGESVAIYVDAPREQHQARIDSIGRAFDEQIHPTNTRLFGPTTDLDLNGHVLVIMSSQLGTQGGIYCDSVRTLGVESFYANWIPSDPIDRPLATLAHEHQHVINAGLHLTRTGASGDELWLNEGMSYAAEALNGYWTGSLLRLWQFTRGQNGGLSMLPLDYVEAFNHQYMMFALYLGDRFGPVTYRNLGLSGRRGVDNVEGVTGMPFEELLRDWFIAAAVSNLDLIQDPRFNYRTVDLHGMAEEIGGCGCLPGDRLSGVTLEQLHLDAAFNITRTLDRADADYYRLALGPGERVEDVFFDAFGRTTVRMAIVRTR
ncbi:MAG TPA: hypothetical protein VJP59_01160 [Gemmatimonadota bacterium]|nr:hypothetical protein [Gemmatimonadota bacterium]